MNNSLPSPVITYFLSPEEIAEKFKNIKPVNKKDVQIIYSYEKKCNDKKKSNYKNDEEIY